MNPKIRDCFGLLGSMLGRVSLRSALILKDDNYDIQLPQYRNVPDTIQSYIRKFRGAAAPDPPAIIIIMFLYQ